MGAAYNPFNNFYMQYDFRDWFGLPDGPCIRSMEFLQLSGCCYVPRFYRCPDVSEETISPNGYVSSVVTIPAGSFILGLKVNIAIEPYMIQITDLGLNRTFFSEPMSSLAWSRAGVTPETDDQWMPTFLTAPYPVVKPGNFEVEIWRIEGSASAIINVCLFCAELQL